MTEVFIAIAIFEFIVILLLSYLANRSVELNNKALSVIEKLRIENESLFKRHLKDNGIDLDALENEDYH